VSTPKALYVCIWPSCPWKGIGFVRPMPAPVMQWYSGQPVSVTSLVRCQRCGRGCRLKQVLTEGEAKFR